MPHEQMIFCLRYDANCGFAVICSLLPVQSNDMFAFEGTFLNISIHENLFMIIKHSLYIMFFQLVRIIKELHS